MSESMPLHIVILAAGQGKRMASKLPKVLQTVAAKPMLAHVLDCARGLKPAAISIVYGHGGDRVQQAFADAQDLRWVHQAEQNGTGHAVAVALAEIADNEQVLVLYGDTPLMDVDDLSDLLEQKRRADLALLTMIPESPSGYGRILRESGHIQAIVEERDATPAQREIAEVNTGILCADAVDLKRWLKQGDQDNAQGEWYLTDVVAAAVAERGNVVASTANDWQRLLGANNRMQLATLERVAQGLRAQALMQAGAQLMDPERIDIRGAVAVGQDVCIDANVVLEGQCRLGDGCRIGPFVRLQDVDLAPGTVINAHSDVAGLTTTGACTVGPFARVREGTRLAAGTRIGNFVETKKARLGEGSKVNHLSYIGDAEVGSGVNIGAGTITCNYDGVNKHQTTIGDGAFIGSGTQLVAPVTVGAEATIGAGSTISRDAPAEKLTLSRTDQTTIEGWRRPQKRQPSD